MSTEEAFWIVGSGLATGLGAVGLFALRSPRPLLLDTLLGFTAGIMLAAACFSLLVPGLEEGPLGEVVIGLVAGTATLFALDRVIPHAHARWAERGKRPAEREEPTRRAILLLSALTIHNIPEGMAVGLAFAAGGTEAGIPVALAIGIQNVPEGFAAVAPLVGAGMRRTHAALLALGTGIVEPPAAIAAYFAFDVASGISAGGLAFAAGAMLYVVVDELIPESHARGFQDQATLGLAAGFVLMLTLDNAFG